MRAGMIFAYDARAHQRWLAAARVRPGATTGSSGGGLAGAELEAVLHGMLLTNPDIVAVRVH